ncbi:MAG: phosphohistidine phosphatase SixA [Phycisphaerales bacterium]|nr:MAG: phosphohistidine phosphatase SixA [Phycisphaerales bacterium]
MQLFIVRHGKAARHSDSGRDADRELTDRGHRQAAYLGDRLLVSDVRPGVIVASPLTRAQQTARPIAELLGLELRTDERLATGSTAGLMIDLIAELHDAGEAAGAIVGHNPDLSLLAARLLGGGWGGSHELRTGQMVAVRLRGRVEPNAGELVGVERLVEDDD